MAAGPARSCIGAARVAGFPGFVKLGSVSRDWEKKGRRSFSPAGGSASLSFEYRGSSDRIGEML